MKPLLAATYEHGVTQLNFPVLGSPKLDGIRCLVKGGIAYSRNLKPIRNKFIQQVIGRPQYNGYDGELIVGEPTGPLVYNRTNSGVMSADGAPEFTFHVFDRHDMPEDIYLARLDALDSYGGHVNLVEQVELNNQSDFNAYEMNMLDEGYEGIMVRSLDGLYKYGRSTTREGILLKVKRFTDVEGTVLFIEPAMQNNNEPMLDHLGNMVRSKHAVNYVTKSMVGAMVVQVPGKGALRVGCGTMTHDERAFFWVNQAALLGRLIKVKLFEYGSVDAPRFARFHGFRDRNDL